MSVSVIIPTFSRSAQVVQNTINSILADQENLSLVKEIIVIDQNFPKLLLFSPRAEFVLKEINAQEKPKYSFTEPSVIHISGLNPSVTTAKNFGISISTGEILVFFDDDVTVHAGTVSNFYKLIQNNQKAGFFSGREVVESELVTRSYIKECLRKFANLFYSSVESEDQYKINGQYVGRIFPNSIMVSNYSLISSNLVRVDGARGCVWASRRSTVLQAGAFDTRFKGTALREETDLYLRIGKLFPENFFTSNSTVTHHRQLGGCDNLAVNFSRLISKFENELYFQNKHFSDRSRIFFFIRLAPLALSTLRETWGVSLIFWLVFSCKARS